MSDKDGTQNRQLCHHKNLKKGDNYLGQGDALDALLCLGKRNTNTKSKVHFHLIKIQIYNEMVSTQIEAILSFWLKVQIQKPVSSKIYSTATAKWNNLTLNPETPF